MAKENSEDSALRLPPWASFDPEKQVEGKAPLVEVNADDAYPAVLRDMGQPDQPDQLDQYWLEMAFLFIQMDMRVAMRGAHMLIIHDPKRRWAQKGRPEGKGPAQAGRRGGDALRLYRKVRGYTP